MSNVSFGLKPVARRILNNMMLYHAVNAGLDAAIFNPLHVDNPESYDKEIRCSAEDLLFNRNTDALNRFVQYFESQGNGQTVKKQTVVELPADLRLRNAVLNRDRRDLSGIISGLLESMPAHDILNNVLLPAMNEVGEKMSSGEMILPFVLQAAEIMKEAVQILEPHLSGSCTGTRGKLIIATVFGDVHDIGKNLVGSILRNQGYEVIDLGKQVPLEVIIDAVKKEKPDALGLSALLVTTSKEMAQCVIELDKQNLGIPVLIGVGIITVCIQCSLENNRQYAGGLLCQRCF